MSILMVKIKISWRLIVAATFSDNPCVLYQMIFLLPRWVSGECINLNRKSNPVTSVA